MRASFKVSRRKTVRTPGGKLKWVMRERKPGHATCGTCGAKLNRARLTRDRVKKLSKVQKRPSRPFPELCSRCMRLKIKRMVK